MGAGASSSADGKARVAKGARVSFAKEGQARLGALDASDVKSLEEAKEEIRRLRHVAAEAFRKNDALERKLSTRPGAAAMAGTSSRRMQEARPAVMAQGSDKDFVRTTVPKSEPVRKLIYHAIKRNMLFRACSEEELQDLVDAFDSAKFEADSVVIKQGDEGDLFYVVEEGQLDILVAGAGEGASGAAPAREVPVGVPYVSGSSFGELALMYGSPRAATIRAKVDCVLWSLDRREFKGITASHKRKREGIILDTLRKVQIGDNVLGDVLRPSDLDAMALATQSDAFGEGDVIIRQGERGDAFYIIESGAVDVLTAESGDAPVARLTGGQFFGEKALMSEDVRQATCVAATDVKCLTLTREDFVRMLGNLQDLLDGVADATRPSTAREDAPAGTGGDEYRLEDLEVGRTLGVGAFGRVKLVKPKPGARGGGDPGKTYALKILSKRGIVDNGLQEHVVNEKEIMAELNHPFILSFHGAMQDDHRVYFLLEVLLGGELFRVLRSEGSFPEAWSRFYAASVMLAFCQIHARRIAYRDLKPENLVLDAGGYLKLVDFGLAKKLVGGGRTWTLCGTPDYLAPEVILNEGHDWAVDYWALGVLVYEMTAGTPPFWAEDPMEVYEKILAGHVSIPAHFSRGLGELVKKLLKTYQSKRLGRTKGGASSVLKQKWFSGFDWNSLLARELEVPMKPRVADPEDAGNSPLMFPFALAPRNPPAGLRPFREVPSDLRATRRDKSEGRDRASHFR